jgi:hypothetical protein
LKIVNLPHSGLLEPITAPDRQQLGDFWKALPGIKAGGFSGSVPRNVAAGEFDR